jgi:hypothetical protein
MYLLYQQQKAYCARKDSNSCKVKLYKWKICFLIIPWLGIVQDVRTAIMECDTVITFPSFVTEPAYA